MSQIPLGGEPGTIGGEPGTASAALSGGRTPRPLPWALQNGLGTAG